MLVLCPEPSSAPLGEGGWVWSGCSHLAIPHMVVSHVMHCVCGTLEDGTAVREEGDALRGEEE